MMKRVGVSMFSALMVLFLVSFTKPKADTFQVDTTKSVINWVGKTIANSKHTGTLKMSKGSVILDGNTLTGGEFTFDMKSIKVTDLPPERAPRLEDHLKSDDFFDVEKFPQGSFKITKVATNGTTATITGNLTLKNITKSVSFPATVTRNGNTLTAKATGVKFNRTEFDVKYRSGNFFSGLGDRAIEDEIEIDIELVATK
jgi:polyisoprenoid-binding protein YceI